jgi:molecular chaperone GrpE
MTDERRNASAGAEKQVKVVDRRRFGPDGAPIEDGAGDPSPEAEAVSPEAQPDDRDRKIAEQAARIDELSRAFAALTEDNKAFRGRLEREKARVVEAERASVAQGLLEAGDDLERALAAVTGASGADALSTLAEGVRLSLAALQRRIAGLGAERIPVTGAPFDPHVAEAIDAVAVADAAQDGVVLQEVRPGYRIGERVLRPARVRVGRLARA